MASVPANSMNLNSIVPGLVNWNGTALMSSTALVQYQTLVAASANTIQPVAVGTVGQVLTSGGAGVYPSYAAIPFTQMPWTDEATTFTPVIGNGYFVTATAGATLPASPAQGNTIAFAVDSVAGVLTITANTGQTIQIGNVISASAGTAVSTANGDNLTLVYRASDTKWIAKDVIGNWSVT